MAKRGRKSKWMSHVQPHLNDIKTWCGHGDIEETIYKRLGVSHESWSQYKKNYPELLDVLKEGKRDIDLKVENALLKRALGYDYEEEAVEQEVSKGASGEDQRKGKIKKRTIKKIMPPDVTAQIFWLKNRIPADWRDKKEVGHSGTIGINALEEKLSSLSVEELRKIAFDDEIGDE